MSEPTARLDVHDLHGRRLVPINKDVFTIGRRAASDLVLVGAAISRDHARISLVGGKYVAQDCGSKFGTFVNGERVAERSLHHGDRIELGKRGDTVLTLLLGGETASSGRSSVISGDLGQVAEFLEALRAIGSEHVLDDVLTLVLDHAIELTGAERGVIMLANDAGALEMTAARGEGRVALPTRGLAIGRKIPERVFISGIEEIVCDLLVPWEVADHAVTTALGIRTILCNPLHAVRFVSRGDASPPSANIGVLYLDSHQQGRLLSRTTRSELQTLARQAAAAIEHARLYREALEKVRVDRELQMAAATQRALLPPRRSAAGFFDADGASVPCRAVGGDFFDYMDLPGGQFGFAIADVAGKGPPAALLTAVLQGIVSALSTLGGDIRDLAARTNQALVARRIEARFATGFFACLAPDGLLTYCNAGHNPPFLVGSRGTVRLDAGGTVLGLFPDLTYEQRSVQLTPGDTIVLFSDGVSEAVGANDEEFGDARIADLCQSNCRRSPTEIVNVLLESVQDFARGMPQHDDITVVVVRYGP
jgi:phosphoserine phosphatase RsbU/P